MYDTNHNLFSIFFVEVFALLPTAVLNRILESRWKDSNELEYFMFMWEPDAIMKRATPGLSPRFPTPTLDHCIEGKVMTEGIDMHSLRMKEI